jgi:hypothetical protein
VKNQNMERVLNGGAAFGPSPRFKFHFFFSRVPPTLEIAGPTRNRWAGTRAVGVDKEDASHWHRAIAQLTGFFQGFEPLPKCFMHQNAPPVPVC